jgi:hypothetical protein
MQASFNSFEHFLQYFSSFNTKLVLNIFLFTLLTVFGKLFELGNKICIIFNKAVLAVSDKLNFWQKAKKTKHASFVVMEASSYKLFKIKKNLIYISAFKFAFVSIK